MLIKLEEIIDKYIVKELEKLLKQFENKEKELMELIGKLEGKIVGLEKSQQVCIGSVENVIEVVRVLEKRQSIFEKLVESKEKSEFVELDVEKFESVQKDIKGIKSYLNYK